MVWQVDTETKYSVIKWISNVSTIGERQRKKTNKAEEYLAIKNMVISLDADQGRDIGQGVKGMGLQAKYYVD